MADPARRMRIGFDLDGTVVIYDEVFHREAVERFSMPPHLPISKRAVRDWFWSVPGGRSRWVELQGWVYGMRMDKARIAPGLAGFLSGCAAARIPVSIISHKTEWAEAGPRVNLRAAALAWMELQGFFDPAGFALNPAEIFFEDTRQAKLERIATQGCTLFVDDLEEVFAEPAFPPGVERWLYAPGESGGERGGWTRFADWSVLLEHVLQAPEESDEPR